ncbi:hypothetical protein [Fibrella forsythiae]|uniref:Uncharacterized protein n=1 Tax=Fibrella forsythiae TaxID=2817061 RepID=A0ABS3JVT2_9BACT|nr:hypothetical protein [Fibrella forsythiae]MBO0953027.1 hypothetical protein [Fibrella forsythiae]
MPIPDHTAPLFPKAEALLQFSLYTSADRTEYRPFGYTTWVDRQTVLGSTYSYGTKHSFTFFTRPEDSGTYVSAYLTHLGQVEHKARPGQLTPMLTVYLAPLALFAEMNPLTSLCNPH